MKGGLVFLEGVFTEAFALVGGSVDEDFGADDVAEGEEHLHQLGVPELLREVVDEQVAALGAGDRAACKNERGEFETVLALKVSRPVLFSRPLCSGSFQIRLILKWVEREL